MYVAMLSNKIICHSVMLKDMQSICEHNYIDYHFIPFVVRIPI
jgi:hypothetical protein